MQNIFRLQIVIIGFTIFSMFFGAGNVVFPLALGKYAGHDSLMAIFGLSLTAVVMPIMGFIAMLLYDGDYGSFFGRVGRVPGFILALLIISLLGPLGSTPRCIAVAFSTFKAIWPSFSTWVFSALACLLIFVSTMKRRLILPLLGWFLTPLLLISLFTMIFIGIFKQPEAASVTHSKGHLFLHGLQEGYNTMDLLAAFFFSATVLKMLKNRGHSLSIAVGASLIGAGLLAATYFGFFKLAAIHSASLQFESGGELLGALARRVVGAQGGMLVCATVALACFTTAIALISAFTDFLHREVFKEKINYRVLLALSLVITFFVSTFEYSGIARFLGPILQFCYPGLILLTFINIGIKLFGRKGEVL